MIKKTFSRLKLQMNKEIEKHARKIALQPAHAFTAEESTPEAKAARLLLVLADFFEFDRTYFPPSVHPQGYSDPGDFHNAITKLGVAGGIQWLLATRDHAKTVYGIKLLMWLHLRGEIALSGVYSELIDKAKNILKTVTGSLENNPRLTADFEIKFEEKEKERIRFRCATNPQPCVILTFSPKRSVRGSNVDFGRLEFLLGDDVETLNSPLDHDAVEMRIRKLIEAYKSCTKKATFLLFGNNFDEDCAANVLKKEQEEGTGREFITVTSFPAWFEEPATIAGINFPVGPLWPECYPAKSEEELRQMLRITDDAEWSEAQGDPQKVGGFIFPKAHYQEWDKSPEGVLPDDAAGVTWCDPNLSLKEKGDTTAMGQVLYSPKTESFYLRKIQCKSYSSSDTLLQDYFAIYEVMKVYMQGFDGNVSQEAHWTNFLQAFCALHNFPFIGFMFRRYSVDDHAATAQLPYVQNRVYFEPGFAKTDTGKRFLKQFHRFKGKKKKGKDDAPDFFICAIILMIEFRLAGGVRLPTRITAYQEPMSY